MLSKAEVNKDETPEPTNDYLNIPEYLICPITKLIYLEPVTVFPNGKCYEKEIIDKLLQEAAKNGKPLVCPLTRIPIKDYAKAYNIELAVKEYLKLYPNARNQQYQRENSEPENSKAVTPHNSQQNTNTQQISEDAALARSMQESLSLEFQRAQELENEQRERRSIEAFRQQRDREQRVRERQLITPRNQQANHITLTEVEKKARDVLVEDIQNLIFALGFEKGPQPRGRIDNFSLLFFALIESAFLEPLPWQKIKVASGPKSQAMYNVLKAAIGSLKEINPKLLEDSKAQNQGEYDRVKTVFAGKLSLGHSNYASFAKTMGTIKNQPGYLTAQILKRVNEMHECIRENHNELTTNQAFNL